MKRRFYWLLPLAMLQSGCAQDSNPAYYFYNKGQKVELTPIVSTTRSISDGSRRYFRTPSGAEVGIGKGLLVKLREGAELAPLLRDYGLHYRKKLKTRLYLLEADSSESALRIANELSAKEGVEYAHPNFSHTVQKR